MIDILASFAAYETEVRGERVLAGQAAARARGVKIGGSKRGKRRKVTKDKIDTIWMLRGQGKTYRDIAGVVSLSYGTVGNILKEGAGACSLPES